MDIWDALAKLGGFTGIAALVVVIIDWSSKRQKAKTDTMGAVVDGAGDLVEHYRKLVGEMNDQLGELRKIQERHTQQINKLNRTVTRFGQRIAYLTGGIHQLIHQIQTMDAEPVWKPDEWSPDDGEDAGRETPMPPGD
jgi:hypothetical protein